MSHLQRKNTTISGPEGTLELSPCSAEYLESLLDPCSAPPSCLPMTDGQSSLKIHVYARGTGGTGANSEGSIGFAPWQALFKDTTTAAGQAASGWFTTTFWAGAAKTLPIDGDVALTAGCIAFLTNTSYTKSQFQYIAGNNNMMYRLVSACLRVRQTSTVMNAGGSVIGLIEPSHAPLFGRTFNEVLAYEQAFRRQFVNNDWVELIYNGPTVAEESQYQYNQAVGAQPFNSFCMALAISSAAASQSFDWEAYANFEIIGSTGSAGGSQQVTAAFYGGKTPSAVDEVGARLVASAIREARIEAPPDEDDGHGFRGRVKRTLLKMAARAVTRFMPAVAGVVGGAASAAIGWPGGGAAAASAARPAAKAIARKLDKKRRNMRAKAEAKARR